MNQQKGVALLLVLWVLALLSILLAGLAGWVQLESRQALWQRQHTEALLAAEAGVNLAVVSLTDPAQKRAWAADGGPHALAFERARVQVSVVSERGKLDLNAASAEDFARLVQACGGAARARGLAEALDQRRGNGQPPLRVIEELRQLPGMNQALFACTAPQVTLWSGQERPDPAFTSPWLRRVFALPNLNITGGDPGPILTLT
ncbi:type II secretion system minor pseudopilin GspK, partial [Pseudomonas sp.]|uniref:type II secretion system minor pseudopilin GspK n=1 Tax=Pseudomonas sp. TaxID=306 RepID=UPI003CC556C5